MKMREHLLFAGVGWIAGLCSTLGLALIIIPAIIGGEQAYSRGPGLLILALILLIVTPAALVGGIVGGRLPKEGGQLGQLIMAAICGMIVAVPLSCAGFWVSGW